MRTLIVCESMYGSTHAVADRMAAVFTPEGEVQVLHPRDATGVEMGWADLVLAGGPTHLHGMSHSFTRRQAVERAAADVRLAVQPDAEGPGIRDWMSSLGPGEGKAAATFDTRAPGAAWVTGRASVGLDRGLRRLGFHMVAEPASFLVDREHRLLPGELERAVAWARQVAAGVTAGAR
jgi:hypothetical protein